LSIIGLNEVKAIRDGSDLICIDCLWEEVGDDWDRCFDVEEDDVLTVSQMLNVGLVFCDHCGKRIR